MKIQLIILFFLIVAFVKMLLDYLLPDTKNQVEKRLHDMQLSIATKKEKEKEMSLFSRLQLTLELMFLKFFGDKIKRFFTETTTLKLQKAGRGNEIEKFYAKKISMAVFFGFFMMIVRPELGAIVVGMTFGFFYPNLQLKNQIKERQNIIKEELPDFLDLMTATFPATSGFDATIEKITSRSQGVLVDEFAYYLNERNAGVPVREALNNLAERCDIKEIYSFVRQVINSQRLGTELSDTLSEQADKMRGLKKEISEIKAKKASNLIVLSMMFLFLAIIVFLMGPSILDTIDSFGN